MSKTLTVPLNIGATTAPHIYGFLFNYTLLGALLVQVYNYHVYHGVNDSYWMHIMVYLIFAMELLQSGLMGADIYRIFGSGCGDIDVLDINHTDWFGVCILGGIVAAIVQSFYTFRLYKFTKSLLVVGIIGTLIVIQLITAFIQGIMSALLVRYSSLQKRPANLIVWIVSAAICDLLISVFMVYYLRKGRTGFIKTDRVISKLVGYAIETGIITALIATSLVVLFLIVQGKSYFEISARGLAKVYSNQLMMVLNSRERVKKSAHASESSSIPLPSFLRTSGTPVLAQNPAVGLNSNPGRKIPVDRSGDRSSTEQFIHIPPVSAGNSTNESV